MWGPRLSKLASSLRGTAVIDRHPDTRFITKCPVLAQSGHRQGACTICN
jgi:hypothetical protein